MKKYIPAEAAEYMPVIPADRKLKVNVADAIEAKRIEEAKRLETPHGATLADIYAFQKKVK